MPKLDSTAMRGTAADFDFFIGTWRVQHRRLKERLVGCQTWEHFEGSTTVQKMLGGQANVDDNLLHLPLGDYRALTLRSFNPASGQWSIWWLDSRHPHQLDIPVMGAFQNGIGIFEAFDTLNGLPIRVRFRWTQRADHNLPRWEQAFSKDQGETWETNWVMDFSPLAIHHAADPCA